MQERQVNNIFSIQSLFIHFLSVGLSALIMLFFRQQLRGIFTLYFSEYYILFVVVTVSTFCILLVLMYFMKGKDKQKILKALQITLTLVQFALTLCILLSTYLLLFNTGFISSDVCKIGGLTVIGKHFWSDAELLQIGMAYVQQLGATKLNIDLRSLVLGCEHNADVLRDLIDGEVKRRAAANKHILGWLTNLYLENRGTTTPVGLCIMVGNYLLVAAMSYIVFGLVSRTTQGIINTIMPPEKEKVLLEQVRPVGQRSAEALPTREPMESLLISQTDRRGVSYDSFHLMAMVERKITSSDTKFVLSMLQDILNHQLNPTEYTRPRMTELLRRMRIKLTRMDEYDYQVNYAYNRFTRNHIKPESTAHLAHQIFDWQAPPRPPLTPQAPFGVNWYDLTDL